MSVRDWFRVTLDDVIGHVIAAVVIGTATILFDPLATLGARAIEEVGALIGAPVDVTAPALFSTGADRPGARL